jgi:rod shape determining protein RodA
MPKQLRYIDYLLALAVTAMAVFGIFMIYAATNTGAVPQFESDYKSQILFVASGFVLMVALAFIDYRFITKFYIPIYALCILLLLYVKFFGTGGNPDIPDRWIFIPIPGLNQDMSIQPSEFAKIFMIIVLAKFIDNHKDSFNHILMLLVILAGIALPVFLIAWQPSLSACIVVLVVSLVVLFTGGLYYRTIFAALAVLVPAALALIFDMLRETPLFIKEVLSPYQWGRIQTFLNPEQGSDAYMQMEASLFSIGSGGLYGKGFMNNGHVPNGHNDFIFAVAAEQFGFVGCMAILGVMAFIIVKCILTALRAEDVQGRLIAAGTAGMLLFETFVNVCVVTELLPNTGMAFPFLSAGGSIMWVHMIAIGLVINISIPRDKPMFDSERE